MSALPNLTGIDNLIGIALLALGLIGFIWFLLRPEISEVKK